MCKRQKWTQFKWLHNISDVQPVDSVWQTSLLVTCVVDLLARHLPALTACGADQNCGPNADRSVWNRQTSLPPWVGLYNVASLSSLYSSRDAGWLASISHSSSSSSSSNSPIVVVVTGSIYAMSPSYLHKRPSWWLTVTCPPTLSRGTAVAMSPGVWK